MSSLAAASPRPSVPPDRRLLPDAAASSRIFRCFPNHTGRAGDIRKAIKEQHETELAFTSIRNALGQFLPALNRMLAASGVAPLVETTAEPPRDSAAASSSDTEELEDDEGSI